MSGWSGFTDEELRRMKDDAEPPPPQQTKNNSSPINEPIKIAKLGQQKKRTTIPKWDTPAAQKQPAAVKPLPPQLVKAVEQSKSVPVVLPQEEKKIEAVNGGVEDEKSEASPETLQEITSVVQAPKASQETEEPQKSVNIGILSDAEQQELKMSSLIELQIKQKQIEDENKKRQKLIQQTLQEKFKQTQTESQKLKDIHRELKLVDTTFQADIDGLRCRIDDACVTFSHAQRRYEKAEKEYVTAKLDYFEKKDIKDELTEQLYAIIQDNEVKKAKKLEELMTKLSADSENSSASVTPISLSPPPPLQDQIRPVAT